MNQNIITYLNENKEKYLQDALITELHKAGYSEGDIAEGVAQVFGGTVPAIASAKTSFWNFKDKKAYTKASEKWADFLFGVFAPMLVAPMLIVFFGSLFSLLFRNPLVVPVLTVLILDIVLAIHLFNRRRPIFYGMVVSWLILPLLFSFIFIVMVSRHLHF